MAPEVGLEPTTLRLTASELPSSPTAIDYCKSLYTSTLDQFLSTMRCYSYALIAIDFEIAWAQKWAHSFLCIGCFYKTRKIEKCELYDTLPERSQR